MNGNRHRHRDGYGLAQTSPLFVVGDRSFVAAAFVLRLTQAACAIVERLGAEDIDLRRSTFKRIMCVLRQPD